MHFVVVGVHIPNRSMHISVGFSGIGKFDVAHLCF